MPQRKRPASKIQVDFLIPLREDVVVGNGSLHSDLRWKYFDREIYCKFGDMTKAPGLYDGIYTDPKSRMKVHDKSIMFFIVIEKRDSKKMIGFIKNFIGPLFRQRAVYCKIGYAVYFISSNLKRIDKLP